MATVSILFSCDDDNAEGPITVRDKADLADEALTEAYFQDLDDMAGLALDAPSDVEYGQGRIKGTIDIEDPRFACDGVVISLEPAADSKKDAPKGTITIDFGASGCADNNGIVRKGKVIIAYSGKRFMPGTTVVATVEDYYVNGVKLEGTRTLVNLEDSSPSTPRFTMTLDNGKAIFGNGLVATRESEVTWTWNRTADPQELVIEAGSQASGETRLGRDYSVNIVEPLIFRRKCLIPVSGIKEYTLGSNRKITVDYGDGECDRKFTITLNGDVSEIDV